MGSSELTDPKNIDYQKRLEIIGGDKFNLVEVDFNGFVENLID